ncbi:unnamed protein product [Lepeophtheirus salmonis]|uniref:(salmon louse) hypothetical protein n=1 Tax=Lepeophtheirus salmonis TaxID=72036 RepID=A0A7R8CEV1_LEPSM|nr:unnamed protein product [Lepeophtheirus salmonis]CAF2794550.1 unnamed protein product [Lepeophtheirus salmonis]
MRDNQYVNILSNLSDKYLIDPNLKTDRYFSSNMSSFFLMSLIVLFMCLSAINAGKGKIYYDEVERQKQYEEEEKGKVAPMRTFLTTWEIALICIFSIIGLFLLIGLLFYLCRYGCVLPSLL